MMEEIVKSFAEMGAMGVLAALLYYQNNKSAKDYADRTVEQAKMFAEQAKLFGDRIEACLNVEKGRTEMLVKLVIDNTSQTTANTEVVRALHRRLDKEAALAAQKESE